MDKDFSAHINKLVDDISTHVHTYRNVYDFLMSLSHRIAFDSLDSQSQPEVHLVNILDNSASVEDNGWILVASNRKESIVVEAYDDSKNPIKDTNHPNPDYINNPLQYKWMRQNCTKVVKIRMRLDDIKGHTFYTVI